MATPGLSLLCASVVADAPQPTPLSALGAAAVCCCLAPLVVLGAPGCGKSALITQMCATARARSS